MSIDEALDIIELEDKSILIKMQRAKSYGDACKAVEELQKVLKKQKRIIAKKYHPDIGGDEEKFKKISDILDQLLEIKAQKAIPRPQSFTVVIRTANYESTYTNTASTMWWTSS